MYIEYIESGAIFKKFVLNYDKYHTKYVKLFKYLYERVY